MSNTLPDRLAQLEISPQELSQIVNRPLQEVEGWIDAETLGGEAAVLIRFLADDDDARRRADRVRRRQTESLLPRGAASFPTIQPFPGTEPRRDGDGPK